MIFVAGSANLDFVVRADHIPAPGETVLGRAFQTFPGGKGANQAIACARAGGVSTHMLLALGNDAYAAPLEASLADAGVALHVVRSDSTPTGTAFICVSDTAENAITVAPGANSLLAPEHLPPLKGFSHLLLQLETPPQTLLAYAQAARAQGMQVVLNAAPAQALAPDLLAAIDVLIVNEGELAVVAQHKGSVAECLARLAHQAVPCVVVTLGHRGCCAQVGEQLFFQPAFAVKPVDTTAAGDSFCGAFTAALAQDLPMPTALQQASAAGALACTRPGAQTSIPSASEVLALVQAQGESLTPTALADLQAYCGLATP